MVVYLYDWFRLRNRDRTVAIARLITGAYFGTPGNTTPDHVDYRPCWARHRWNDPDDRASGECLPRWVSPHGYATRLRQRRDSNPDHGRDRTVCSPNYTTSAGSCPGRNRTDDLRIQSPAPLARGDSGARRSRSVSCGDAYQRLLVRSARTKPPVRPLSGTNADQTAASLIQFIRLTLGSGGNPG